MDLHEIISLVPGIVYQFRLRPDGSTCVPYASEAIREIYRLDPEEIREDAAKVFTHVHPEDLESHLASIKASARDLTPWQHEYRLKFDDGTVRWLFGNALPQREADGSILWHGFITDITERKAAEELLRFHSEILLNLSEGIFLIRASDGVIVFTNPQFERMFGYGLGELFGKHVSIVNAPGENSPEAVAAAIMSELARTGVWSGEVRNIRKDGTAFWCHVNVLAFVHPQFGNVWVSVHEDVTERKNVEDELRQTKKRYDFATAVGKVGTWDWNPVTGDLIWSDETFRLMGLKPGAVTPSYELFLDLAHPDDRVFLDGAVRAALHDKKTYTLDCRFILGGGEVLVCNMVGKVEFDAKGQPIRMLGTIQDITERKQAEQALANSENRFREIFNTVSDAIFIHDAGTGRILDVNRRMLEMYGLSREQALACGPDDLSAGVPPYSSAEAIKKIRLAQSAGPQTFEWLARARDGRFFWVEVSLRFASIGGEQRILAVVRDISERKHVDAELRIAAIAFESQDGIVVTNADSVILRVNRAFTEITGYTAEEAIGQTPRLLRSGLHDKAFYAEMWASIRLAGAWHGEIWNRHKNGEIYPERLTITAVKGNAGETTNYVATLRVITEQKRVEEALQESEALLQATMKILPVGLWIMNAEGKIVFGNTVGQQIWAGARYVGVEQFGEYKGWWLDSGKRIEPHEWSAARAIEKGEISIEEEIEIECFDGTHKIILNSSLPLRRSDGSISGAIIVNQDITERKQAEEQIRHLAFYDTLTQLPNRRLLNDRIGQVMAASKRSGNYGALMFLDLDNFKPLNDTHGHDVGDLLLVEAAGRIACCVREVDTVARFGGDEFVVMLGELDADKDESTEQVGTVAEKIRATLAEPYFLTFKQEGDAEITVVHHCTSSIGVALFINHEAGPEDVLKWADIAMYQAKEGGRNRVHFYGA